jgi:hypothetical protein
VLRIVGLAYEGRNYAVIFHVIKIDSNKNTFPILLGRPWLRMSDAIVDWGGGAKPSITYGPKDNKIKVSIGSLGGWMKKEITSTSKEEENDKEGDKDDVALVGVVHSRGQKMTIDSRSCSLGHSIYHWSDNGEYSQWLRDYSESVYDIMVTSHHASLSDEKHSSKMIEYSLLEHLRYLPRRSGFEED